jgi:hypothetical protein
MPSIAAARRKVSPPSGETANVETDELAALATKA